MICDRCNCYNEDGSEICSNCGADLDEQRQRECGGRVNYNERRPYEYSYDKESKSFVGSMLNLFLGILGLIIGLMIYPYESFARKTFVTGWLKMLVFRILVVVIAFFAISRYFVIR